jgi:hypothetical protein
MAQVRACPIAGLAWAGPGRGRSSVFAEIEKAVKPDRNSYFADFFKNRSRRLLDLTGNPNFTPDQERELPYRRAGDHVASGLHASRHRCRSRAGRAIWRTTARAPLWSGGGGSVVAILARMAIASTQWAHNSPLIGALVSDARSAPSGFDNPDHIAVMVILADIACAFARGDQDDVPCGFAWSRCRLLRRLKCSASLRSYSSSINPTAQT